ncbi:MAG: transposase [Atopobiaceae bacterium]|nr:transposase [Atopobiaceae bacterium]
MPHTARKKGNSGFYHVVPKGIADQLIFENDIDRRYYLKLLREAIERTNLRVHAYCLMSNHVHLIVEDEADQLAAAMKYVHERYAMMFAEKIGRTGGIFRKPYWSEPIDTDEHFLCAVRYTHANPAAAGICRSSEYEWSSVKDYLGRPGMTETKLVLEMLGGRDAFIRFSAACNSTAFPFSGSKLKSHLTDDEALRIAVDVLGRDGVNLASANKDQVVTSVSMLKRRGFSTRQVSRICGISQSAAARI